ncbi:MAG: hypothetical protein QNJ98_08410 [Planctomycetota bacterium]|nr:hypothetical protein [Planctomycetota bacterium]
MRRLAPALLLLLFATPAASKDSTTLSPGYLRIVHLTDGLRSASPKQNLRKLKDSSIYKTAQRAGLDLTKPPHDLIAYSYENNRLFYVFYKVLEGIVSDRPYVIQRIKKTVRNWTNAEEPPEEIVTYQVETFKTLAGSLKRADQHFGSFGLRTMHKREVVKEYEIGIATIRGDAEGRTWPYEERKLYRLNQPYQAEIGIYDNVRFEQAIKWTLSVSFDREGFRIHAPELGIDAPSTLPEARRAHADPNKQSEGTVLRPGRVGDAKIGEGGVNALTALGKTRRVDRLENGAAYHQLDSEITAFVDKEGVVRSMITHAAFAGMTDRGIRHGAKRSDVMKTYGVPKKQYADAETWFYDGIRFTFDGYHRVVRMSLTRLK